LLRWSANDKATEISKEAHDSGRTVREVARQMTDLSEERLGGFNR